MSLDPHQSNTHFVILTLLLSFQIQPEAAFLYDAVWLYARAVHEILLEGEDPKNGTLVASKLKFKTYQSKAHHNTNYSMMHWLALHYTSQIEMLLDLDRNNYICNNVCRSFLLYMSCIYTTPS